MSPSAAPCRGTSFQKTCGSAAGPSVASAAKRRTRRTPRLTVTARRKSTSRWTRSRSRDGRYRRSPPAIQSRRPSPPPTSSRVRTLLPVSRRFRVLLDSLCKGFCPQRIASLLGCSQKVKIYARAYGEGTASFVLRWRLWHSVLSTNVSKHFRLHKADTDSVLERIAIHACLPHLQEFRWGKAISVVDAEVGAQRPTAHDKTASQRSRYGSCRYRRASVGTLATTGCHSWLFIAPS